MKLFLKRISVFLLPIIITGGVFEYMLRKIPNDYKVKTNLLEKNAGSAEILVLGNSHAYHGVNPAFFSKKCINAAYVSQTIDYDLRILQNYESRFKKLEYILVPVSYSTLFTSLETSTESWRKKNYVLYTNVMSSLSLKNNSEILGNNFKVNVKRLLNWYKDQRSPVTSDSLGFCRINRKQKDMKKTGHDAAKRHTKKSFDLLQNNIQSLVEIIEIANRLNAKVVLFTPPAWSTYVRNLNKPQLQRMDKVVDSLAATYKNVRYYNFMESPGFIKSDFYDADHLNGNGAKKFSTILNDSLKSVTRLKKK